MDEWVYIERCIPVRAFARIGASTTSALEKPDWLEAVVVPDHISSFLSASAVIEREELNRWIPSPIVDPWGIEPQPSACKADVLPLSL